MEFNGYKCKTTFWDDFTIADHYGTDAVNDTYKRAFNSWKNNAEYLTELTLVLNWKLWYHYENGNDAYAELYNRLWTETDHYAIDNLTGDDLVYFYDTTD